VQALLEIFAIRSVRFCEPRDHAAQAFCGFLEALPVAGHRVADSASAARGADIVVTLTTSSSPVLRLADIAQGTFVAGVGADNPAKHELAPDLLRSSLVVPDLLAQASTMGDLHHAIETGAMTRADVYAELADVIAGNRPGRRSNAQRFVFDSTGLAIQDIAAAEMIYERALLSSDLSAIALNELRSEVPHVRSRAAGPA
jgi:ornithine cyclodeaminase/alanine dehydrogenase-like protein (mu-crystallin family)